MITKRQAMTLGLALVLSACGRPTGTSPATTAPDTSIAEDQAFAQRELARPGAQYQVQVTSFWYRYRLYLLKRRFAIGVEDQILTLVNAERARNGAGPLTMDATMRSVARTHSIDMIAQNYFAHNSPDGKTPADRLTAAGVAFNSWAENIAYTSSSDDAAQALVTMWINSSGHHTNMINASYSRTGIGVWKAANGNVYATEVFAN